MARVDRVVFDKTGTLTRGDIRVDRCIALTDVASEHCLNIAAALELSSEHPLARAFQSVDGKLVAESTRTFAGCGVEGSIDVHRYRIGTPEFVALLRGSHTSAASSETHCGTLISLGDEHHELALLRLTDTPREEAPTSIADRTTESPLGRSIQFRIVAAGCTWTDTALAGGGRHVDQLARRHAQCHAVAAAAITPG